MSSNGRPCFVKRWSSPQEAKAVPFTGYSTDALAFLSGLEAENSRTYFQAHRKVYEREVLAPTRALVGDLGRAAWARVSAGLQADPRVGRSLFRINRDLRFTKDPTPYNPWVDVILWEGSDTRHSPSLILRMEGEYVTTGAGIMGMQGSLLERFRRAVADHRSGEALAGVLREIGIALPGGEISKPRWTRVPADYPPDHPRAELLRCDTVHVSVREPTPSEIHVSQFVDWLMTRYERFTTLHHWLVSAIG